MRKSGLYERNQLAAAASLSIQLAKRKRKHTRSGESVCVFEEWHSTSVLMVVAVDGGVCVCARFFRFIFVSFEMHSTVLPVNGNTYTHICTEISNSKSGDYIKLISLKHLQGNFFFFVGSFIHSVSLFSHYVWWVFVLSLFRLMVFWHFFF